MSANNSASLSSVVVVGDLFRVTLPGESAFRSHKVTKKVEEGKRGGRRRRGNENTRRVPSLRGSMLVVVSDRRTVNEARVGFLSRREDNVLRGGRERRKGKERERKSFSSFTLSSLLHRPLPVFCIRYRICPRPGHRPESVYIYIYIYIPRGEGWALLLGWCPEKKERRKRILLENNYSTFGLWRPRRGLSPLNIEILSSSLCSFLDTFIWMDLSSPLQLSMIFRDLYIESHRGVETPLLFRGPVAASGTDLCILSYCDSSKSIYFIFEAV